MKKLLFGALLCIAALSLAGCRALSSSVASAGSAAPTASSASGSFDASSRAASLSKTLENTSFDEMMTALTGYQPGTSGGSLKRYIAACGVLNFAQQYDDSRAEQLRSDLDGYLSALDKETLAVLKESREDVDFAARDILSKGVDGVSDILSDAGNPNQYDIYDSDQYEAVARILGEALAEYD